MTGSIRRIRVATWLGCCLIGLAGTAVADGDALEREVPAAPRSLRGLDVAAIDTANLPELTAPAAADAANIARMLLAMAELVAPPGHPRHLPAAERADRWSAHARRLLDWLQRHAGDTRTSPPLIDAAVTDYPPAGNLRAYPPGRHARLPADVLAGRGGTSLECALTVALLGQLLGLDVSLERRPPDGTDGEPDDGSLLVHHWTAHLPAFRDPRVAVASADAPRGRGRAVPLTEALRELLDSHTQLVLDGNLPPTDDATARRAELEYRARLLGTVLELYEKSPEAVDAWPATVVARSSQLIEVYDDLIGTLDPAADADRRRETDDRIGKLLLKAREYGAMAPDLLYQLARRAERDGNAAEAIGHLRDLLRRWPDYHADHGAHPRLWLARLLAASGDVDGALRGYREALDAGVATAEDCARAGDLAWNARQPDLAREFYEAAASLGFAAPDMHLRLGLRQRDEAMRARDDAQRLTLRLAARARFRAGIELAPTRRDGWLELIRVELELASDAGDIEARQRWAGEALRSAEAARSSATDGAIFLKLQAEIHDHWFGDEPAWLRLTAEWLATPEGQSDRAARAEYDQRNR